MLSSKKANKQQRVLMGVIDLYLEEGKPIGSNTLKECGFGDLSSATIRNYFASLEEAGYLEQMHASGGRIPTDAALRMYADEVEAEEGKGLDALVGESKEVANYLRGATELLSEVTGYPIFLSSPRFDHDLVLEIKLLPLDSSRCLCVLMTDFGSVLTEVLSTDGKLEETKKLEEYFSWRLTGLDKPKLTTSETKLAEGFYKELMVRYITRYSSFSEADVYRTGFSKLLDYPEFSNASTLAGGLALFENVTKMRALLADCVKTGRREYWIGESLAPHCTVMAIPYFVGGVAVGAVGLLGPTRVPYGKLFGLFELFSKNVSESLSKSLGKFRIQYRRPETGKIYLEQKEQRLLEGEK